MAAHVGLHLATIVPHVIANVLVMVVPLMPIWQLSVGIWLACYVFAQMERPPQQSYTMAFRGVQPPEER